MINKITIQTKPAYPVYIGDGLLADLPAYLGQLLAGRQLMLVCDTTVNSLYGDRVLRQLRTAGFRCERFVFSAGESAKSAAVLLALLNAMAAAELNRRDALLALGGGVTGDLAGLAAALYMRGIDYIQLPTTLLAAVDSSVGGKTAINLPAGKNLVGAFWQPKAVFCDTDTFASLPAAVWRDGMAEVIKTALIADAPLFRLLSAENQAEQWQEIISRCVEIKAEIVMADEREAGRRQLLNFGHTIGHAIESCSNYTIGHGHAVAAGMWLISKAAVRQKICAPELLAELTDLLRLQQLPLRYPYPAAQLAAAALHDKKRSGDRLNLVLPLQIGQCCFYQIAMTELEAWLQAALAESE
ncbi:MAG: 3-dehydroquinate synthase [Negativicutes bacterium]|nr:3-dehydroquinate synthase [Negativicutes bacterium]